MRGGGARRGERPGSAEGLFEDIPVGAVVTAIRPTARDPTRCTIRVGRKTVATLDRRRIDELGVKPGDEWTSALAERVQGAVALSRAVADAMRSLSRRARTRGQIIDGLVRKGHGRADAEAAAERLVELGLLDDRAYAEAAAREILARKPAGKRFIESKLRQRRVGRDLAAEVAGAATESRDELADALRLATRRARALPGKLDGEAARRRLYGYLARRGFDGEVCRRAVEEALEGRGGGDDAS